MTNPIKPTRRDLLKLAASIPFGVAVYSQAADISSDEPDDARRPQLLNNRPDDVHRILTCNILLDLEEHEGKLNWKKQRRNACLEIIRSHNPDIICLQEVGDGQYEDFQRAFPGMASHGFVGAVSDTQPRRFQQIKNVIFYDESRYKLVSCSEYVLSDTPHLPLSHYSNENLGRHVNWVRLRDRKSGKEFRVLDTHLSLKSPTRVKETALIAAESSQYADDFPQVICGDFNARLGSNEINNMLNAGWHDSYHASDSEPRFKESSKIDFIFTRGAVETLATQYIDDKINGVSPSDHPFVGADVKIG